MRGDIHETDHARVVIIGGGAVGCSTLYHLAQAGLDRLPAAGDERADLRLHLACGRQLPELLHLLERHQAAAPLAPSSMRSWATRSDYPMNYHVTGSIRLAHTKARMDEYAMSRRWRARRGSSSRCSSPTEIKKQVSVHRDGRLHRRALGSVRRRHRSQPADPGLCQGRAGSGLPRSQRFTRVTGLERTKAGEWLVKTDKGDDHAARSWSTPPAIAPARSWPWSGNTCRSSPCRTSIW